MLRCLSRRSLISSMLPVQPPTARASIGWDGPEDEDRDPTRRFGLVVSVQRKGADRAFPPLCFFVPSDLAGQVVLLDWSILQLDVRVGLQVVAPNRVLRRAAQRGDRRVLSRVLDPHQWCLAQLVALGP